MANSLAQYLADLQVQIKEAESQLVFGVVISTSPLRVKYGEITLEDNFLFVEDGLTLTVGQKVPMLKTNRSQLFIVMLSNEMTPQDILSAIKTVDGSGSGIDADLLDGKHASDFSLDGHTQAWSTITSKPADNQFPNTAEAIGASKDLNDYTTAGFYYQSANANASSGSNYPVARAGTLIVTKDAGTTQMYYEYNGTGVFYRTFYGSTWTAWQNLLTPTWANVSGKPSTFAPSTHNHTWSQLSGGSTGLIPTSGSSGSYTSVDMSGSKGGYAGLYFTTYARYLMVNATIQGFHTGSAWQWYFNSGVLTAGTVPWARLTSVPTQATRWPAWSEVTSKPTTATRWPTWAEVTSKPSTFTATAHTHTTGTNSTSGYVKFDNGLKLNWVKVTIPASTRGKTFTWSSAFTSAVYATWASSNYYDVQGEVDGATKTGGAVNAGASSNQGTVGVAITWTAYGIGV